MIASDTYSFCVLNMNASRLDPVLGFRTEHEKVPGCPIWYHAR
jgi:hypothetical protein